MPACAKVEACKAGADMSVEAHKAEMEAEHISVCDRGERPTQNEEIGTMRRSWVENLWTSAMSLEHNSSEPESEDIHPMLRHTIVLLAVILLSSCFSSKSTVEKRFPGGDLYDEKRGLAEEEQQFDELPTAPKAEITVERRQALRGLRLNVKPRSVRVKAGNPLLVDLTLTNENSALANVTYSSDQRFDVLVYNDYDQRSLAYVWSADRYFTQKFEETFLGAGVPMMRVLEVKTATNEAADAMDESSRVKPVRPGIYFLWGTHEGDPFLADGPIEIEVYEEE